MHTWGWRGVAVWLLLWWLLHQTEGVLRAAFWKGSCGRGLGGGKEAWGLFIFTWFRRNYQQKLVLSLLESLGLSYVEVGPIRDQGRCR